MNRNFDKLVKAVDIELEKSEKAFTQSKKSAQEISETSRTSWSQAGDRYHSEGSANLAKQKFDSILALKKELEEKGESVCFSHNGKELFLVDNPILISGFTLVSTKSPLGLELLKKK